MFEIDANVVPGLFFLTLFNFTDKTMSISDETVRRGVRIGGSDRKHRRIPGSPKMSFWCGLAWGLDSRLHI